MIQLKVKSNHLIFAKPNLRIKFDSELWNNNRLAFTNFMSISKYLKVKEIHMGKFDEPDYINAVESSHNIGTNSIWTLPYEYFEFFNEFGIQVNLHKTSYNPMASMYLRESEIKEYEKLIIRNNRLDYDNWVNKEGQEVIIETMSLLYLRKVKKLIERNYKLEEYENTKVYKSITLNIRKALAEDFKKKLQGDEKLHKIVTYILHNTTKEELDYVHILISEIIELEK